MAKKKKKDKLSAEDVIAEYTLDSALKTSKTTESTLHNLLQSVSEETSFVAPKKEETRIEPQLSYETKRKIAEDYALEDKPLSERGSIEERSKISEPMSEGKQTDSIPEISQPEVGSTKKEPSFSKKDNIYSKLGGFFEELFESYTKRYDRWENSISSILSILRKMRKITKKNSEDLVESINSIYKNMQHSLENFKLKRNEVEKVAEVNVESMSSQFKKVLGLLELQVKEYQFKRLTDEYVRQQKSLM
jgi:hypothetical protein